LRNLRNIVIVKRIDCVLTEMLWNIGTPHPAAKHPAFFDGQLSQFVGNAKMGSTTTTIVHRFGRAAAPRRRLVVVLFCIPTAPVA
jgi:hypothetical protein